MGSFCRERGFELCGDCELVICELVLAKGTGAGDFGVGTIGVGGGIRRASSCICRG